jgi:hypothetical protein
MEDIYHSKVDVNRLYIKRLNSERGLDEMESACNAAIVGLSEYITQGRDRPTRSVQEYDAGKTEFSIQKEANLLQQKCNTQGSAAQNIK